MFNLEVYITVIIKLYDCWVRSSLMEDSFCCLLVEDPLCYENKENFIKISINTNLNWILYVLYDVLQEESLKLLDTATARHNSRDGCCGAQ